MNRIWAPWRKKYIATKKKMSGCIFCRARRASVKSDAKNLLLYRSPKSLIVLNLYPYNNGHLLIVPNRHVSSIEKLNDEERLDLLRQLDLGLALLREVFHPQGFNVGVNLGHAAGAGIPGHVHLHIVPRWEADTNFMPIFSGTRVISDSLQGTYQALTRLLKKQR